MSLLALAALALPIGAAQAGGSKPTTVLIESASCPSSSTCEVLGFIESSRKCLRNRKLKVFIQEATGPRIRLGGDRTSRNGGYYVRGENSFDEQVFISVEVAKARVGPRRNPTRCRAATASS